MKEKDIIENRCIDSFESPTGYHFDNVDVTVYDVKVSQGVYRGYKNRYGIEVEIRDDLVDGVYEYYVTVDTKKVGAGSIKALYLEKIKNVKTYESLEDLILTEVIQATIDAEDNITSVEGEVNENSETDQAKRALESLAESDEMVEEMD